MIRKDTQYIHKIKKLVESYGEMLETIEEVDGNLRNFLLNKCKEDHKIVTISLTDGVETHIEGLVKSIDGEICIVNEYDVYGNPDGQIFCSINDISRLAYNRKRARKLYVLIKENNQ